MSGRRSDNEDAPRNYKIIGTSPTKPDGPAKCTGETRFADDIFLPRMLHCKIQRSPIAHAKILHIDTSQAEKLPGVEMILTGEELPITFGILPVSQDEHALCPDIVRFVGDPVVAVAALEEEIAFEAMNLINVKYEPLTSIMSISSSRVSRSSLVSSWVSNVRTGRSSPSKGSRMGRNFTHSRKPSANWAPPSAATARPVCSVLRKRFLKRMRIRVEMLFVKRCPEISAVAPDT